jgi:hypothetical protein
MKNIKIANININIKDLFLKWVELTHPFHKLTNQKQKVLALFLFHHYNLKKEITNEKILFKILFDYDIKQQIKDELNIKDAVFQNIMHTFRKQGIILNNKISPNYIPSIQKDAKNFKLIFNFNIIHG